MNKSDFVEKFYPYAKRAEEQTGVPALFALAQSALESGWGKSAPGNMLFGMKTGSGKNFGGWQGHKQLITTTEFGDTPNMKFPEILPGYPKKEGSKWKYIVKDYFRAYQSPLNTFLDWAGMLSGSSRYSKAMQNRADPFRFADDVAAAGYATDPGYAAKVKKIMLELIPFFENPGQGKSLTVLTIVLIAIGIMTVIYGVIRAVAKKKRK